MNSKTNTVSPQEAQRRFVSQYPLRSNIDAHEIIETISGTSPQFQQNPVEESWRKDIVTRLHALEEGRQEIESRSVGFVKINMLPNKKLKTPLDAILEPDDKGFIARTPDIPLYGYGDDAMEALDALKCEIESLHDDLMEDDKFTDEWLRIKEFLHERIVA